MKTSETNLFRSITEGKVSDTRTSDQAWLSYSSTRELRDLHNFTVQVRSIGVMATCPLPFDPCPYALLLVRVCSLYRYCIHMSCIHYRHRMPESEASPIDSGHMSTSQVLRIPESYFEEKSLGQLSTCEIFEILSKYSLGAFDSFSLNPGYKCSATNWANITMHTGIIGIPVSFRISNASFIPRAGPGI